LSYPRVREAISIKIVNFVWINGKNILTDIGSKHWSYPQIWHMLQAILFYSADTSDLIKEDDAMRNNDDCNNERGKVVITSELLQKKKCLQGIEPPEASEIRQKE
jgi:hypothetical protein